MSSFVRFHGLPPSTEYSNKSRGWNARQLTLNHHPQVPVKPLWIESRKQIHTLYIETFRQSFLRSLWNWVSSMATPLFMYLRESWAKGEGDRSCVVVVIGVLAGKNILPVGMPRLDAEMSTKQPIVVRGKHTSGNTMLGFLGSSQSILTSIKHSSWPLNHDMIYVPLLDFFDNN